MNKTIKKRGKKGQMVSSTMGKVILMLIFLGILLAIVILVIAPKFRTVNIGIR